MEPVSIDPQLEAIPVDEATDGALTILRVHPMVWKHALEAADGDARRIEIIDESNVTVHNRRVR
jgi:hypothetical protein